MKTIFTKQNFEFLVKELIKTLSTRPSFFSKKRVEGSVAFIIGQIGMIIYLIISIKTMGTLDIIGWATIQFGIAGYMVNKIEKSKIKETNKE